LLTRIQKLIAHQKFWRLKRYPFERIRFLVEIWYKPKTIGYKAKTIRLCLLVNDSEEHYQYPKQIIFEQKQREIFATQTIKLSTRAVYKACIVEKVPL
jgi:hypothetical protein